MEVDAEDDRRAPISPVTWAKVVVSSVFSSVSCTEWLRTTVSRPDWPGVDISVLIGSLGRPGSIKKSLAQLFCCAQRSLDVNIYGPQD